MNNVTIDFNNNKFSLLDKNNNEIFNNDDWFKITKYADKHNLNIVYQPKDLVFSFEKDENNGFYLFLDIKYGDGGHDNLGSHNVKGLPSYVNEDEEMECHFSLKRKVSKKEIIKDMNLLGSKFSKDV